MLALKSPTGVDQILVKGGSGISLLKLDGIYCANSATNTEKWNISDKNDGFRINDDNFCIKMMNFILKCRNGTSTIHIDSLSAGETVHAVHLDGNLNVSDSDAGTVLVGMMIQATMHVNGHTKTASALPARDPTAGPPLGFLTFIGLVDDYDVIVSDDKSVVIEDLYCEQLKVGHLKLSGTGSGDVPGRVTIQGVKSDSYTPAYATIDNYYGSLFYMSSMFLEKSFPEWTITQTGSREFNMTLIGNDFDANDEQVRSL